MESLLTPAFVEALTAVLVAVATLITTIATRMKVEETHKDVHTVMSQTNGPIEKMASDVADMKSSLAAAAAPVAGTEPAK
jgi:hypothetical protein